MGIHPVFHVSLLEPVRPGHESQTQDTPLPIEVQDEQWWLVDRILDSRLNTESNNSLGGNPPYYHLQEIPERKQKLSSPLSNEETFTEVDDELAIGVARSRSE
ncbi:uncharacterized protein L203_105896 [Cryptococcus depauperatus CBS 7841]|uniref:Uncharacterized protein n=1 Tax=Cryptococcus depauperatus CBS 7841 TaxID=1295531 RepID=A0AAJ8JYH9_9TREE